MSANLPKSVTLTIGQPGRKHDYEITYKSAFNTGKLLDIEILKMQLSGDKYSVFKTSYLVSMQKQALNIDMIATFNTLIPDLKKNLTVKNFLDLDQLEFDEILKVYIEDFLPWYNDWVNFLNDPKSEEESAAKA